MVIGIFFVVAFVVGLARHAFSSQVRNTVKGSALGSLAVEIARSAIEEAYWSLQTRLNDPQHNEILASFRSESGPSAFGPVSIEVPDVRSELATDPLLSGFELAGGSVQVEFIGDKPLHVVAYEYAGVFRFAAIVTHRPTGVRRQLAVERNFKMCLLSTPRPFDQFMLCVLRPENLWGYDQTNDRIRDVLKIMNDLKYVDLPGLYPIVDDVIRRADPRLSEAEGTGELRTKMPLTPGASVNYYARSGLKDILDSIQLPNPPRFTTDLNQEWHFLPNKVVISSVNTAQSIPWKAAPGTGGLDLSFLHLLKRLNAQLVAIESKINQLKGDLDSLVVTTKGIAALVQQSKNVSSKGEAESYIDRSDLYLIQMKKQLTSIKKNMESIDASCMKFCNQVRQFTEFFTESSDDAADWLRNFAYKLDREELQSKATIQFSGTVNGLTPAQQFLKFLKTYNTVENRPLNGVIYVDNEGTGPLELNTLAVKGKLVLACSGDVRLNDVTLADPAESLLTVLAEGTMRVSGRVEASLVPRGTFLPAAGVRMSGNLILERIDNPEAMRGYLENPHLRDVEHGRYFSGTSGNTHPNYTYASWAPWQSWSLILRN